MISLFLNIGSMRIDNLIYIKSKFGINSLKIFFLKLSLSI